MASSPPTSPSPAPTPRRPVSQIVKLPRSSSRMSISSKHGLTASRSSDDDSKTSVRVAVRVRPPLKASDPGFELIPQRFQRSMVQVLSQTSLAIDSPQGKKVFVFDRVFDEDVEQQGVWDYLRESINSFIQGYNVSVLAYGQSGAGKSYTMGTSGPAEQGDIDIMGVIPRAASALFEKLGAGTGNKRESMSGLRAPTRYSTPINQLIKNAAAEKNWTMKASYVEIYNEQLRDLLLPDSTPLSERPVVSIREDAKGRILLTGLHQIEINTMEDLLGALNFGSTIRQTDATAINAKSSRSHAIFSLQLIQKKPKGSGPTTAAERRMSVPIEALTGGDALMTFDSKLHFVDLAGSERLKNTGAYGDRAKEGISINAGLASLGKVISQLSSRQAGSHVSYRDSKLTRLLQDSLGGNAITYMVACVTPAEFHLSETLNTVQYAQRARAIQSKPRIQATSEDSDKQAVIDRLRAEVTFLREQISSIDRADRRSNVPQERHERQNEREIELQNTLLDTQENYTALSQRHAKLITEIAKARDAHGPPTPTLDEQNDESAGERMKRSNFFAQEVDKVLLEYEKTIQALEASLTSTRGTLSASESVLLEKETKLVYSETVNSQLQSRLQKMMDRESSTENYLKDLESKLDGHSTGEEKSAAVVSKLRSEIARIRENEAACEDYISTLEERLAEADQDAELMQRELERLEHVVERQRSLGKLDNLLYELDHLDDKTKRAGRSRSMSRPTTAQDERVVTQPAIMEGGETNGDFIHKELPTILHGDAAGEGYPQPSPAQSQFVNDKLESVTQELLGLRVDHESTVQEYEHLALKYEEALRTLGELQDAVDEARHSGDRVLSQASTRPTSFLDDARMSDLRDGQQSSSRSLSSELSLAGELGSSSTEATEIYENEPHQTMIARAVQDDVVREQHRKEATLLAELETMKRIQMEKEENISALTEQCNKFQEQHQDSQDQIEELKAEVQKAQLLGVPNGERNVFRRKSSQGVMVLDRAHRSFAGLKNIASENLEGNPDALAAFEVNLNTAMHELHSRSERVQELESQIDSVKKEMDTKVQIISGLTRERTSIKQASPVDVSVVSSMRDQLLANETQLLELRQQHASREGELATEINTLKSSLETHISTSEETSRQLVAAHETKTEKQQSTINGLHADLAELDNKHKSAIESIQESQAKHSETMQQLEAAMADLDALREKHTAGTRDLADLATQREGQESHIASLQKEIGEHQTMIVSHVAKIQSLTEAHTAAQDEHQRATTGMADEHAATVAHLSKQIDEHTSALADSDKHVQELHVAHAAEVENLRGTLTEETEAKIAEQAQKHETALAEIKGHLTESQDALKEQQTRLAKIEASSLESETIIEKLHGEKMVVKEETGRSEEIAKALQLEVERATGESKKHIDTISELKKLHEETLGEMSKLAQKDEKSTRLIEELENELSSTFDQHQKTNNRLSTLQTERNRALEDAQGAIESYKEEIAALQTKLGQVAPESPQRATANGRSSSITSVNLRKSPSTTSLPSPPPAIPLPPLPNNMQTIATVAQTATPAQPPTPTMSRRPSKDLATSQLAEDQEARIRTIEKHLFAEKQLTATLEEALTDLERQGKKTESELTDWKKKFSRLEDENERLKSQSGASRYSMQAVEEERVARREAETARAHLEERMNQINKKKGRTLMCF